MAQATATAAVSIPSQEQYRLLEQVWDDPAYQETLNEIIVNDQSDLNQRTGAFHQIRQGSQAQNEMEDADELPQVPQRSYNIDEVYQAVKTAQENGTITEQTYNDIVETLAYTQSDLAEGRIDEADYHGRLGAVMERIGQPGSSRATLEGLQTQVDQDTWDMGQRLAQALGRNIVFYNGPAEENGFYKNGTIYVNTMGADPVAQTIGHELTHSLESTKEYGRLKRFVFAQLARQNVGLAQLRSAKQAEYKRHGVELKSQEAIDKEIVAEYVQKHLLTDEQAILELVRTDRNVAQRIWEWLKRGFRRVIGKKESRERARLESAMRLYEKALRASQSPDVRPGTVSMGAKPVGQGQTQGDGLRQQREATEEAYRRGEISDEEYDSAMDAFEQAEEERLAAEMEQYSFSGNRNVAKNTKAKYNRKYSKVFFKENVFPPYNESQSDSHEVAERWARSDSTQSGDCRLLSHHGQWYLIQTFRDMKYGYQIMKRVATKDYDREARLYGTVTGYESLQDSLSQDVAQHHRRSSDGDAGYRPDHDESEYRGENREVHELGTDEVQWTKSEGNGARNRESRPADRTGENGSSVIHNDEVQYSFAGEQYYNTAGEIEARDASNRRSMTADERKNTPPDLGGEDTVFVDQPSTSPQAIGRTVDNKPFVTVTNDILAGVNKKDWVRTVKQNLKRNYPNGIVVGRNNIRVDPQSRRELTYSGYMQWLKKHDPQAYADKLRATDNADEILLATTDWVNEGLNHPRKDKIVQFARGNLLIRVGNSDYAAKVVVATESDRQMKLYDVLDLKRATIVAKEMDAAKTANPSPGAGRNTASISTESISQNKQSVKENAVEQYSFSDMQTEEQNRRPLEGWYTTDEKALQAKKKGYPVLHGEQVVPMNTWVQAQDRGNYGLVTGRAPDGRLLVSFHNKHDGSMADDVALPADQLIPVDGAYQMTKEEFASLMESEPLDVDNEEFSEEDMRAMEELYRRSGGEEKTVQPVDLEKLPKKAQRIVGRAKNRLLRDLAKRLGVSKFVDRSHLQVAVDSFGKQQKPPLPELCSSAEGWFFA